MADPEKKDDKTTPPPPVKASKTKPVLGQYAYIGQDEYRFLFQDRETKKCYTIEKSLLVYRGEHKFQDAVLATIQK